MFNNDYICRGLLPWKLWETAKETKIFVMIILDYKNVVTYVNIMNIAV